MVVTGTTKTTAATSRLPVVMGFTSYSSSKGGERFGTARTPTTSSSSSFVGHLRRQQQQQQQQPYPSIHQSTTTHALFCSNNNNCHHDHDDNNSFGTTVFDRSSKTGMVAKWNNDDDTTITTTTPAGLFRRAWNRTHGLMERAGLDNSLQQGNPFKNPIVLLLMVIAGKYIRAKFIMKGQSKMNEFQPAWGHVITSKEQEKALHAYMCKNCGTTIFIAKGREFRFFNQFAQCLNCGKVGRSNFKDIRDDVVEEADDGEFVYESPVNYRLSKRERKQLEEQQAKEAEELKQLDDKKKEVDEEEQEKTKLKKKKKKKKKKVIPSGTDVDATAVVEAEVVEVPVKDDDTSAKQEEEKEEAPKAPVVVEPEIVATTSNDKPKPKPKPTSNAKSSSLGDLDILDMD